MTDFKTNFKNDNIFNISANNLDIVFSSSSYKRGGCNPPIFSNSAPEAKRSLVNFYHLPFSNVQFKKFNSNSYNRIFSDEIVNDKNYMFYCNSIEKLTGKNKEKKIDNNAFCSVELANKIMPSLNIKNENKTLESKKDYCSSLFDTTSEKFFNDVNQLNNCNYNNFVSSNHNLNFTLLNNIFSTEPINKKKSSFDEKKNEDDLAKEEDFSLSDLPTSVDDFQNKEFYLKLEKNFSSPRNKKCQSPCCKNFTQLEKPKNEVLETLNTLILNDQNIKSKTIENFNTKHDILFASNIVHNQLEELDDNDLEVAMINESFEAQQNQLKLYKRMDIKSLFYATSNCTKKQFLNNNADQNINANFNQNFIKESEFYYEQNKKNDSSIIQPNLNEFIPLLTPKSRQFVMQQKQRFSRLGKYKIPSISGAPDIDKEEENFTDVNIPIQLNYKPKNLKENFFLSSFSVAIDTEWKEFNYNRCLNQHLCDSDKKEIKENKQKLEFVKKQNESGDLETMYNEKLQHYCLDTRLKKMMLDNAKNDENDLLKNLKLYDNNLMKENEKKIVYKKEKNFTNNQFFKLEEQITKIIEEENSDKNIKKLPVNLDKNANILTKNENKSQLPNVLIGLGPSTSAENIFNISDNSDKSKNYFVKNKVKNSFSNQIFYSDNFKNTNQKANKDPKVSFIDCWENLDNDVLSEKIINQAKSTLNKIKAEQKISSVIENSKKIKKNINDKFNELNHVLEVIYQGFLKNKNEILQSISVLTVNDDVWHKEVDNKRFLIIFSNSEKAFQAIVTNRNVKNFFKINFLQNASKQSQEAALKWKSELLPKKRRPATTITVARRMIENSLNQRFQISSEQRRIEAEKLENAKEQKRQKQSIWEN